jgi:hypothetical protein
MDLWQLPRDWAWFWAWRLFAGWSRLDVDPSSLTAFERWSVVATTMPAVVRSRYLKPVRRWLLARTPAWIVARRLQQRTHRWYRVPSEEAADHVRLRFDIWPIEVGDHVRLQQGRLTAVGYSTATFSEIIFVLPNGEIEPDPGSSEMNRAWAAYVARH